MLWFGECLHVQCQIHPSGNMRNHQEIKIAETNIVAIRFFYTLSILRESKSFTSGTILQNLYHMNYIYQQ